jgi:hypothetical protein
MTAQSRYADYIQQIEGSGDRYFGQVIPRMNTGSPTYCRIIIRIAQQKCSVGMGTHA